MYNSEYYIVKVDKKDNSGAMPNQKYYNYQK